jgi:HEPN domain-containing protein
MPETVTKAQKALRDARVALQVAEAALEAGRRAEAHAHALQAVNLSAAAAVEVALDGLEG